MLGMGDKIKFTSAKMEHPNLSQVKQIFVLSRDLAY